MNVEPRAGRRHADQFLARQSLDTRRPGCSSRAFVCFDLRLLCDRTRKNQPQAGSVRHTLDTQQEMAVPEPLRCRIFDLPFCPSTTLTTTTPPSIPPKSLPWGSIDHPTSTSHLIAYGSALNSSPWLFRRLSRVERPATAPRHPPSLRLPATFPSLALIEVTIGNTPGTGRCSLAVTHAPTTPFSHLGGPSACKRDQGAVVRTPGGTLG